MFLTDENIKKIITQKANELGFVRTGFAKAEILLEESENLKNWLEINYDADMKWIEKGYDKRKNVNLLMEDAKTVISLAYNYYTPFAHDNNKPKISRYAWGKDYHKILKKKLKELCKFIENNIYCEESRIYRDDEAIPKINSKGNIIASSIPKINSNNSGMTQRVPASSLKGLAIKCISYVDDGPVMDKVWAKRSGIGWQGKHTNIIDPEYGSWLFLCEIITNLDCNVYDLPIEDLCGSCHICIDACPTGAIIDEYKLDSNLCISYQTIENKGDIPDFINLHGWIFGCDICQDVCPFNKNDKPTNDKSFYPQPEIYNKSTEELNEISEKEFNEIFADSSVKRTKYKGWKRNLRKYTPMKEGFFNS